MNEEQTSISSLPFQEFSKDMSLQLKNRIGEKFRLKWNDVLQASLVYKGEYIGYGHASIGNGSRYLFVDETHVEKKCSYYKLLLFF